MTTLGVDLGSEYIRIAFTDGRQTKLLKWNVLGESLVDLPTGAVYVPDTGRFETLAPRKLLKRDYVTGWTRSIGCALPLLGRGKWHSLPHRVLADVLREVRRRLVCRDSRFTDSHGITLAVPWDSATRETQRAALLTAARQAGFPTAHVISFPEAILRYYRSPGERSRMPYLVADASRDALTLTLLSVTRDEFRVLAPPHRITSLSGRAIARFLSSSLGATGAGDASGDSTRLEAAERWLQDSFQLLYERRPIPAPDGARPPLDAARMENRITEHKETVKQAVVALCDQAGVTPNEIAGVFCAGRGFRVPGFVGLFQPWQSVLLVEQASERAVAIGAARWGHEQPALSRAQTDPWLRLQRRLENAPRPLDTPTAWAILRYNAAHACGFRITQNSEGTIVAIADAWIYGSVEKHREVLGNVSLSGRARRSKNTVWQKRLYKAMQRYMVELDYQVEGNRYRTSSGHMLSCQVRGEGAVFQLVLSGACQSTAYAGLVQVNERLNALRVGLLSGGEIALQTDALEPDYPAEQARVQLWRLLSGSRELEREVIPKYATRAEILV